MLSSDFWILTAIRISNIPDSRFRWEGNRCGTHTCTLMHITYNYYIFFDAAPKMNIREYLAHSIAHAALGVQSNAAH